MVSELSNSSNHPSPHTHPHKPRKLRKVDSRLRGIIRDYRNIMLDEKEMKKDLHDKKKYCTPKTMNEGDSHGIHLLQCPPARIIGHCNNAIVFYI